MDEMKLKLTSNLMRGFVSKIISKLVYKQFGYRADIHLNDIQVKIIDGKANIHLDVDGEMENEDFVKFIKSIDSKQDGA